MTARKIKVLHVLPWITSGGVERRRLQLTRGLDPARFEQHVLCKEQRDPLAGAMREAGAMLHQVPGSWAMSDVGSLGQALSQVEGLRPDIIHGAVFEGVVFAALLGYMARVPHVIIEETGATPTRSWRGDLLMSAMSALSHRSVAVSPYVARYLSARSRISPDKLRTITNGVAFPRAVDDAEREATRAQLGVPAEAVLFGCVGRVFNKHKRFSDAIDALALLPEAAHLVIVGAGPDLEMLRARARGAGVEGRAHFAGYQGDVAPWMRAMDVFMLTSSYEAFGLVVPEAMSVGLPVIGTRVDAIPDIVAEHRTGLLVPPADPAALAGAMGWMLEHPTERARMGAAGRARAHERFNEARYVEDVRALYESLIAAEAA